MNPKCTLPEPMRREALLQFDRISLTGEEEQQIRRMFPQYLFFRNEYADDGFYVSSNPIRLCTCTACGESFEAVRGNYPRGKLHHERCNCPHCGAEVEGIAAHKFKYDMPSLERWIKATVARTGKDGALLIEAGNVRRRFNWDDLVGQIDWFPTKRYYFGRDGSAEFTCEVTDWGCGPFYERKYGWKAVKTICEPFNPAMMGYADYDGRYQIIGLQEALGKSVLKYCQIFEFYQRRASADLDGNPAKGMMKYLGWANELPQIEMAVKLGLEGAVEDLIISGKKNARYLNWNAKRPNELIRMLPADGKAFFRCGMDFSDLVAYRDSGTKLRLMQYLHLSDRIGGTENLRRTAECCRIARCTPEQGVNYVLAHEPECARYAVPPAQIIQAWKDYLEMAERIGYDLREKSVAMPKNLQERHDAAADTITQQKNADEMIKYKARRRKLEKKYAFALGELCVLVPISSDEIIREGKTLQHCVAGYAPRHIKGTTTILFIRHRKKPGRSFLTVELQEVKGKTTIAQIHGYKNERYPGAVEPEIRFAGFLETWLDWVNAGSERDRDGNPILPAAEQIETEVKTA